MDKFLWIILLSLTLTSCNFTEQKNKTIVMPEKIEHQKTETKDFSKKFFSQISVSEFKKEMENPEIILIDVRTPWELPTYWKIRENQKLIDINNNNFAEKINKLDKSKKYLVYCFHWNRSVTAREFMRKNWFSYIKDLKWWIDAWTNAWESVIK